MNDSTREAIRGLHEHCPCLRRQTHADASFDGCRDRSCQCYYLGEGLDQCLWPLHAALDALLAGGIEEDGQ